MQLFLNTKEKNRSKIEIKTATVVIKLNLKKLSVSSIRDIAF